MTTTDTNVREYSTMDGLKTHPLWLSLTDKQQVFLETFIRTGSRVESVKAAFEVSNDNSAAAMASRTLQSYAVRQLLAAYHGYTVKTSHVSRAELLSLISGRLRKADLSQAEFRNLSAIYADVKGWRVTKQKRGTKLIDADPEDLNDRQEMMRLVQQYEQEQGNTKTRRSSSDEEDES